MKVRVSREFGAVSARKIDRSAPQADPGLRAGRRPEDHLLSTCEGDELAEYLQLADDFGFVCADIEAIRLRQILSEHGTALHDRQRVRAWLDHQFAAHAPTNPPSSVSTALWGWRPLRARDQQGDPNRERSLPTRSDQILHATEVFNRPVPMQLLRAAVSIQRQFAAARFFASDWIGPREGDPLWEAPPDRRITVDPFLAVQLSDSGELFVIGRWTESAHAAAE
jgi:hypothetical protein